MAKNVKTCFLSVGISRFSLFLAVSGAPGGDGKLEEKIRIHPVKFRSLSAGREPRNDGNSVLQPYTEGQLWAKICLGDGS